MCAKMGLILGLWNTLLSILDVVDRTQRISDCLEGPLSEDPSTLITSTAIRHYFTVWSMNISM